MADVFEELEDVSSEYADVTKSKEEAPEPTKPKIPSKFEGKSIEDVVAMYQEAEKLIGRQGQEIGEVRKLADQLIQSTFKPKEPEPEVVSDDVDFFVDPKAAIERAISNHPKLKQAEEKTANFDKFQNQIKLEKQHPDMYEIVESDDFINWVKKSKVRQQLYTNAHNNFDYDSADELLSTFKELRGRQNTTQATEQITEIQSNADRNLNKAAVSAGTTQDVPKKIYRRADLIRLRLNDPNRYDALEAEIMAAYAEGRVR